MKNKILHITVHMGGGIGKAVSGLCMGASQDYDNAIIVLERPNNLYYIDYLKKNNISAYIMPNSTVFTKLLQNADLLIINWWGHPLMVKFLQMFPPIPCRCIIWNHINGCNYPYLPASFLLQFSASLFTTSYSFANTIWSQIEKEQIDRNAVLVYGMGNFIPQSIVPKASYHHDKEFIIGYMGTIDYAKINKDFLTYYMSVIRSIPHTRICMLGHVTEIIRQEIEECGLEEYFILPGYVSNIEEYVYKMDVFAYLLAPDNYATTENALLEAMAYGLPIVALNNPVERYIIANNVSGYLVNNVEEFQDRIAYLHDEANARRLGQSARKFVIGNYSFADNLDRFFAACEGVLKQEKKIYDFSSVIGKTGYEAFRLFSYVDGDKIMAAMEQGRRLQEDKEINPIFYGEFKGSIIQYARYFPEDKELKKMVDYLK